MNELILIGTLVLIFGSELLAYILFGRAGLYVTSALATILANVEVLIMINAFGMEQTLGNVLLASTFLATDILSECEGKKSANKAVYIGLFASLLFLGISQSWLVFEPSESDTVSGAIATIFSNTPRMIAASLAVYVVSQLFDVWLYHKWWSFTEKKWGNKRKFLWLRNNGSTLVSQIINTALFTFLAFVGTYDFMTMLSIFGSSYLIYIVTSLLDTPIVYLARRFKEKREAKTVAVAEAGVTD